MHEERAELAARGIRLTAIGDLERLPAFVRGPLAALIEATRANRGMTLCLALSYGGRESLVRAAQRLAQAAVAGRLRPEAITESDVARALDTRALPPPDLVIRTSGEQRLSNFLLWEVGLRRALLHRRDVARLRPRRAGGGPRRVCPAPAPLRPARRVGRVTI